MKAAFISAWEGSAETGFRSVGQFGNTANEFLARSIGVITLSDLESE
ncbi:MAG: hypothetical protein IPM63_18750 [Acidobacteriota bacterium]|nr:MAG: hypothetical protein IPM63_18750 [Acidobacteriota bacterium]